MHFHYSIVSIPLRSSSHQSQSEPIFLDIPLEYRYLALSPDPIPVWDLSELISEFDRWSTTSNAISEVSDGRRYLNGSLSLTRNYSHRIHRNRRNGRCSICAYCVYRGSEKLKELSSATCTESPEFIGIQQFGQWDLQLVLLCSVTDDNRTIAALLVN